MRSSIAPYVWVLGALGAMLLLNAAIGPVAVPPGTVVRMLVTRLLRIQVEADWPSVFETILFQIRLPQAILVGLTGMALGGSGAVYQGIFRNPLADPYIIGVASGAGLGAVLAMAVQWPVTLLGMAVVPAAAFVGAVLTVSVVYGLARVGRTTPITTLILAGVAVSAFTSALTSLLMLLSTEQLHRAVAWLLGGFALGGWEPVVASLPYFSLGLFVLVLLARPLNVMQFGDEQAAQLGLNVERYKFIVVAAASLVAATAVSFSGVIGFVGLVVPHLTRLLWGPDYRRLIPLATVTGGAVLLAADVVARTILAPRDLPVGIVTAVLGAPFFLYLLRRAKQARYW
ncbi:MAG: iron chelate uptake ABC transporter family permease subunit [Anaerolineales bacterium]|nr:iron chelate uptake ABC transporter family permease subunit [Anaerolineales bacterium]